MGHIYQDLHGWRLDGDVDGVQVCLFDPPYSLNVHIKDADQVLGTYIFHSSLTNILKMVKKKKKKQEVINIRNISTLLEKRFELLDFCERSLQNEEERFNVTPGMLSCCVALFNLQVKAPSVTRSTYICSCNPC